MRDDKVLPFTAEEGADAYFGPKVGPHVSEARRALRYADRRLLSLRELYDDPGALSWHVEMELAEFLMWARQVRVSIDAAVKAAGAGRAATWWSTLRDDPELVRFTQRRNRALKLVESASQRPGIAMDIDGVPHAVTYYAFADEPFEGDPVFPRCQKHLARLHDLAETAQGLLPQAP